MVNRTATGVVAFRAVRSKLLHVQEKTCLEHLDECNAKIEVCSITANERQAEEKPDGHNGSQIHLSRHLDIFPSIQKGCGTSQNLGHEGTKAKMPSCEYNREGKAHRVQDPLVEQNDTGAGSDPRYHIHSGGDGMFIFCFFRQRIDRGQDGRAGLAYAWDIAREALLLFARHGAGRNLGVEEGLEGERSSPFEMSYANRVERFFPWRVGKINCCDLS